MQNVLAGIIVCVLGGGLAALMACRPGIATALGAGSAIVGAAWSLPTAISVLLGNGSETLVLEWDAIHGRIIFELDPLGAAFLLPILGLTIATAAYGADYLWPYRSEKSLGAVWFFFNMFVGGMALVVVAQTVLLFVVAWEFMSLAAFFLVTFEHERPEVRRAGWVYLVATHLGLAFLFAAFLILGQHAGSLELTSIRSAAPPSPLLAGLVFALAFVGFGAKAGLVPFHVWLPEAHPAAPSHVSALMSGVMIKVGLYGMLRVMTFLGTPAAWWGLTLAVIGLVTALVGIALAVYQRDIKRVLAYSSIENIGLIALAFGIGFWGQATNRPIVATLGMGAGLLHVWNHAVMKSLMFLCAGSIVHATGTRDLEQLGGLMKRMPWTASLMILGSVAIAALPPLNGFASKWLIYLALLQCAFELTPDHGLAALLAIGLLALVGGLAAVTFVRLSGIALLGTARGAAARAAHESSPWLVRPMLILAAACVALALLPFLALDCGGEVLRQLQGVDATAIRDSLTHVRGSAISAGMVNASLWIAIGAASTLLVRRLRPVEGVTWGCGYAEPTERMQYTGQSFAELVTDELLPRSLGPAKKRPPLDGLFPTKPVEFSAESIDPLYQRVYEPLFDRWARRCARLRILQQGQINLYLAYIVLAVVAALMWMSIRSWWRLT